VVDSYSLNHKQFFGIFLKHYPNELKMTKEKIKKIIKKAVKDLQKEGFFQNIKIPDFEIEFSSRKEHGDYSSNIAFLLAKEAKKSPRETARIIKDKIFQGKPKIIERVENLNGFLNFFLSGAYLARTIRDILEKKENFARLKIGRGQKVNLEFISANPTGPLHLGNARGGFCGDVLANVLERAGYRTAREYYVNDMGRQVLFLANSLKGKEPSYKNEYIQELKKRKEKDPKKAIRFIVSQIKKTTKRMGIKFDKWVYESSLEKEKKACLDLLKKKNLVYQKDNALWFKSSRFGDDKDRVLLRSREKTIYSQDTYFLSDIAYLKNKFDRGFDRLIFFLGAEHFGYLPRLKAAAQALGFERERIRPIIFQLVKLFEKGKEVKMSKRKGSYITIDELLDEVGVDAARFFFLLRSYNNHLLFDLDLAKEQSEKNPVFYIQYAHARICSILKKAKVGRAKPQWGYKGPNHPKELQLIKKLIIFPEIIEQTAKDYQIQRLPQYALGLATAFHQFYQECQVISKNKKLSQSRLGLVLATKIILKEALSLMGISAPEKM